MKTVSYLNIINDAAIKCVIHALLSGVEFASVFIEY